MQAIDIACANTDDSASNYACFGRVVNAKRILSAVENATDIACANTEDSASNLAMMLVSASSRDGGRGYFSICSKRV